MNIRYLHNYCEEAGDEGGKGGGAGGEQEPTAEQLQAQIAELKKSNESILTKNNELLSEAKKAKTAKRDAEAKAEAERIAKAKDSGDHEQLLKSSEEARLKLQGDFDNLVSNNNKEKINNSAMKLATELADGYNAEILSESIAKRLKMSDGELKVTDANGALTVSTLDDLKTIFKNDEKFKSLLKGNQASGGGAAGGDKSGGAAKTLTRAEHDALGAVAKAKFFKEGGKLAG